MLGLPMTCVRGRGRRRRGCEFARHLWPFPFRAGSMRAKPRRFRLHTKFMPRPFLLMNGREHVRRRALAFKQLGR